MTLIKGDGIGPEISQAVIDIFQAAQVRVNHVTSTVHAMIMRMAGSCGVGECECGSR